MKTLRTIILPVFAVAFTVMGLWHAHRPSAPKASSVTDVQAEAERGGYKLIRTVDLLKMFGNSQANFLVVDTRQEWEYRSGHIKGAVNFPMEPTWLSRWRKKGALKNLLGPDKERNVIFY